MMAVNENQFKQLGEILSSRFYQDLMTRLNQEYPDFFQNFDVNIFLEELKKKKQSYCFDEKSSIEYVAEYMILNGIDFDEKHINPDIYELLQRNDLAGDEKIDRIYLLDLEQALEESSNDDS